MNSENTKSHIHKIIAPVIISALIVIYYVWFGVVFLAMKVNIVTKIFAGIIPFALAVVCIYVLMERIIEIRSGEEDDLSKY